MTFERIIRSRGILLTEGAIVESIRRDRFLKLDPHIMHAEFVFEPEARTALSRLYRAYIDIAESFDLPIIVGTPTWRASRERVQRATNRSHAEINEEAARFLQTIRSEYGSFSQKIWIAGMLGCRGDAYSPAGGLSREESAEYHEEQARVLARSGVDFLLAATLPSAAEAYGLAEAMGKQGIPYIHSFIFRPNGTLLDGTPLHEAVTTIDTGVDPRPLCYWANCVHPSVFDEALRRETDVLPSLKERLIGLQANTSPLPPEALDGSPRLRTADPPSFAAAMLRLNGSFGTSVLGGCCGTAPAHIRHLADLIRKRIDANRAPR